MPAFEEKSVLISTNAGNCVKKQLFGYGCGIRNGLEKQAASEKNERGRRARFPPHRKLHVYSPLGVFSAAGRMKGGSS